jgi:hypothetical protein
MKLENERAERDRQFELEKLRLLNKKEVLPIRSEFDEAKNIRLVPEFQENAVDKYFPQFESCCKFKMAKGIQVYIITKCINWKGGGSLLSANYS